MRHQSCYHSYCPREMTLLRYKDFLKQVCLVAGTKLGEEARMCLRRRFFGIWRDRRFRACQFRVVPLRLHGQRFAYHVRPRANIPATLRSISTG
jgi:hypothetical protein